MGWRRSVRTRWRKILSPALCLSFAIGVGQPSSFFATTVWAIGSSHAVSRKVAFNGGRRNQTSVYIRFRRSSSPCCFTMVFPNKRNSHLSGANFLPPILRRRAFRFLLPLDNSKEDTFVASDAHRIYSG